MRILNHKYKVAAERLDRIQLSLNQGLLVDMRRSKKQQQMNSDGGNKEDAGNESDLAQ